MLIDEKKFQSEFVSVRYFAIAISEDTNKKQFYYRHSKHNLGDYRKVNLKFLGTNLEKTLTV